VRVRTQQTTFSWAAEDVNRTSEAGVSPQILGFHDENKEEGAEEDNKEEEEEDMEKLEGEKGIEEDEESETEEALDPMVMCVPCRPTQEEVDKHNVTHFPFTNWCPGCVRGKARSAPHRTMKKEESEIPVIQIDYGYLKEGYIKETRGEGTGKPILIIKDSRSKWVAAHVVPRNGAEAHAIHVLQREIEKIMGYKKIILRSDQEPAIIDLKNKLKKVIKRHDTGGNTCGGLTIRWVN
jgi:hypothetical protein